LAVGRARRSADCRYVKAPPIHSPSRPAQRRPHTTAAAAVDAADRVGDQPRRGVPLLTPLAPARSPPAAAGHHPLPLRVVVAAAAVPGGGGDAAARRRS